jgi:5-(carboxyamino)imidazole ribonucleotide mutase
MTLSIDVFFGSTSDENVFHPLLDMLSDLGIDHRLEVCSAHRNPDKLRELVKSSTADLFIAGAGLSAHLPGVIAAHTLKPVIGLPCNDVMKGLDAFIASMQLPSGVPVLASGVENLTAIRQFLSQYMKVKDKAPVVAIEAPASAEKLLTSLTEFLKPYPFTLETEANRVPTADVAVYMVNLLEPELTPIVRKDAICLPYLPEDKPWDPRMLLELSGQGGLWVGINNVKNTGLALVELWNSQGQWDHDLYQNRGGVPLHV